MSNIAIILMVLFVLLLMYFIQLIALAFVCGSQRAEASDEEWDLIVDYFTIRLNFVIGGTVTLGLITVLLKILGVI